MLPAAFAKNHAMPIAVIMPNARRTVAVAALTAARRFVILKPAYANAPIPANVRPTRLATETPAFAVQVK